MTVLGIMGGSGLYEIAGLKNAAWKRIHTPFGETSDEFLFGELDGQQLVFVPRHGRGHRHSPTSINYRANIDALKRVGVTDILSLSACGFALRQTGTLPFASLYANFGTAGGLGAELMRQLQARLGGSPAKGQ